jgi:hypothetical protein
MHYFWFVPLLVILAVCTWIFYLAVARRLPKTSDRSVEGALAAEHADEAVKTGKSHAAG